MITAAAATSLSTRTLSTLLVAAGGSGTLVNELGAALSQSRSINPRPYTSYYYSTSASSRQSWATVGGATSTSTASGRKSTVAPSHLRQRRPIVNGEAVAFHVNDLPRSSLSTPPPRASLLSTNHQHRPAAAASTAVLSSTPLMSFGDNKNDGSEGRRRYDSDMVVVLDMDECLIHSKFLSPQNAQFFAYQLLLRQNRTHRTTNPSSPHSANGSDTQQHYSSSSTSSRRLDTLRFTLPDGDLVLVNLRPGLMDFLKAVSAKYETHIFTASMSVYADPLLDQLDPTGSMITGRWYREHCTYDESQKAYVKDLDRLPFKEMGRVVLVDNNPLSFLTHPNNGILVSSFYNDPNDNSLQSVWNLLQELDRQPDVRPHLEQRFGIKKALAKLPANTTNLSGFRSAAIRPTTTSTQTAAAVAAA